jgi:hypothetical protein
MHKIEKRALRNVAQKEKRVTSSTKAWVSKAIKSGRYVPAWIADLPTEKQFREMMELREVIVPKIPTDALRNLAKLERRAGRPIKTTTKRARS